MAGNNPRGKGPGLAESAKETAPSGGAMVSDAASTALEKAKEGATFLGKKAEDAASIVGGGMKSLAGTLREKSPQGGMFGSAGSAIADTLENTGGYLQTEGLSGIGEDLTGVIRRSPLPAVLVSLSIGFLLGRALRS